VESCQTGISSCPSSCNLRRGSFWGAKSRLPDLLELLVVRSTPCSCWSRESCAQGRYQAAHHDADDAGAESSVHLHRNLTSRDANPMVTLLSR
jgi:hypothetical protein